MAINTKEGVTKKAVSAVNRNINEQFKGTSTEGVRQYIAGDISMSSLINLFQQEPAPDRSFKVSSAIDALQASGVTPSNIAIFQSAMGGIQRRIGKLRQKRIASEEEEKFTKGIMERYNTKPSIMPSRIAQVAADPSTIFAYQIRRIAENARAIQRQPIATQEEVT